MDRRRLLSVRNELSVSKGNRRYIMDLSLYSTATQNYWLRGLALGNAKIKQHVGIFALPPTPTPDASQWNIGGVGSSGVGHVYFMYISCCLCIIFCAKADSSGIWALSAENLVTRYQEVW